VKISQKVLGGGYFFDSHCINLYSPTSGSKQKHTNI